MERILYTSKLKLFDYLESILIIGFSVCIIVVLLFTSTKEDWRGATFVIVFFVVIIIQTLRGTKTFILTQKKLIVQRPLSPFKATDVIYPLKSIKEIIFRNVKGRFGGPHILIKAKNNNESYRLDLKTSELHSFIKIIRSLSIKVNEENIFDD